MRKLGKLLLVLAIAACVGVYVWMPRITAQQVQSPYQAAVMLEEQCRAGKTGEDIVFRAEDIELEQVYTALEAIYPYAFSLHITTRGNGTATLRVEVSRAARQEQARQYAAQLAAEQVDDSMDDKTKLRALHDALVRLCQYDNYTAQNEGADGATAPFAADGALLDHKAVCAGYGRAYAMLCEAVGIKAIYVTSQQMDHGWNAVRLDGTTYFIDCTFDDPLPDRGEYITSAFFMLPQQELQKTHTWDSAFYEQLLDTIA